MRATIEKVSPYGVMFNGEWKNWGKFSKVSDDVRNAAKAGLEVDVEFSAKAPKFIHSMSIAGAGSPAPSTPAPSPALSAAQPAPSGDTPASSRDLRIVREAAFKAAFGAPFTAAATTRDVAEAAQFCRNLALELEQYAVTGKFKAPQPEPVPF